MPAPEKLTIETPEHIALEFALAGVGSRFLAFALDTLVQAVAMVVLVGTALLGLALAGLLPGASAVGPWAIAALLAVGFVVYTAYFAAFEAVWSGQTPGKRRVGLRVIDVSGRPVGAYAAIIRNLLRLVDQLPGFYGIGILSVLITGRQQRLGDLAAGTVVVHERTDSASPVARPRGAVRLGGHRLTSQEIVLIEGFLRRRDELDPWVRLQSARQIAGRMAKRLELGAIEDEERFLEQLAAEYRAGDSYR